MTKIEFALKIASFIEISLQVPEKKTFKVFNMYGHGGRLGHMIWTIYINFGSPFLGIRHIKFGFD